MVGTANTSLEQTGYVTKQQTQLCAEDYAKIEILNDKKETLLKETTERYTKLINEISETGCNLEEISTQLSTLRDNIKNAKTTKEKRQATNTLKQFKTETKKCLALGKKLTTLDTQKIKTDEQIATLTTKIDQQQNTYDTTCVGINKETLQKYCKPWTAQRNNLEKALKTLGYTKQEINTLRKLRDVEKALNLNEEQQLIEVNRILNSQTSNKDIDKTLNQLEERLKTLQRKITTICTEEKPPAQPTTVCGDG
ncbi:MAG: hypothetical protein Q7R96_00620, partial [Nanoarchaeota archaeon]|nr:hypothetical protein [Nanoarchaeota archaeon]